MAGGDFFVVRRGATAVPNSLVHNKELSYAALGLIVLCLSLPAGAKVGYRELAGRGLGQKATRAALKELEGLNYRFRFQHRRDGQIRELTIISDVPLTPAEAFEDAERMMIGLGFTTSEIVSCPSHPDFAIPGRELKQTVLTSQISKERLQRASSTPAPVNDSEVVEVKEPKKAHPSPSEEVAVPVKGGKLANWKIINAAIPPEQRRGLMGKAAMRVSDLLDTLLDSGWKVLQIRGRLADNPLPSNVVNPPGLLISRLKDLCDIPLGFPVEADRSTRSDSPPPPPDISPEERQAVVQSIKKWKDTSAIFNPANNLQSKNRSEGKE
ncbi:hypothetical protein [Arcanobacterium haemolyticum]|uniref:Helix-turn-helix domain-containing protein n=1 Tax=Arcanobacterium haemolyticum (strain ATCC 9345 / DSM 20595 / CCM 5947 / CCUG 17215 / LMG 16163 / NBRC 15585 / NCTC 8452 / 11018) TaxID=644284 RepID=D7BL51_ARCHD|nr:hypothetical protein [Arcanobacterium haemolyticum]ADH93381.1 hypothetical protein Arch_1698 [Arcanobacterium haemolyticum DSM 20595]SQH27717.1 Uncharacterised protein [Arcanobacterium haemolyticum]